MELSRRNFVAGAAAVTAAAAAAGTLTGASSARAAEETQLSMLEEVKEADVTATEDADIVVVGSGTSGTFAAIRAAELGAKVIWLEKTGLPGGTSSITEGTALPNSKAQLESEDPSDTAAIFKLLMDWHNWGAIPEAVHSFIDNAGATADWALEHDGVALTHMGGGAFMCMDENGAWENMGEGLLEPLRASAESLDNLDFRIETPAVNIIVEDGAVKGVYAKGADGITRINAKAVILCTGGFGGNVAMQEEYLRVPAAKVQFLGLPGQDGDGINMALASGGRLHAMTAIMYGLLTVPECAWDCMMAIFLLWPPSWRAPQEVGGSLPLVNEKGERFYNEATIDEGITSKLNTAVALQPAAWVICDDKHVETYSGFDEFDYGSGIAHGNLREDMEGSDKVVKADTIEELAEAMGVDAEALVKTIGDWNARIDGSDDSADPLGADSTMLEAISEPPFWVAQVTSCAYSTCGGCATDYNCQVVDEAGDPVPGLYACGLDNGSLYFNDYPYGVYSGTGQGSAACTGFTAANAAVEAIKG